MHAVKTALGCPHQHAVLVVEDDPDIREAVQMILEDEGFQVVTASNGAEAEAELERMDDPCLMLLDLMMPVMSGWELLEHLKRDGKLHDGGLSIVVVSASPHQVPSGPVATMRKPVRAEQLISTVRRYC
ncbi:MAG: chemotaxis protein CheY [Myxococcales bacterium]|nr:chemotaxis protein CheY [Myxococcales bacterium]